MVILLNIVMKKKQAVDICFIVCIALHECIVCILLYLQNVYIFDNITFKQLIFYIVTLLYCVALTISVLYVYM